MLTIRPSTRVPHMEGTLAQLNVPVEDPGRSADPEILESTTLKSFALMWSREGLLHDRASERAVFNLALRGCFHSIRVQAILPLDLNLAADCLERFLRENDSCSGQEGDPGAATGPLWCRQPQGGLVGS